jgi:hypothetical protein
VGKVWVLDTETKGTGAEMRPLPKQRPPSGGGARMVLTQRPKKRPPRMTEPTGPRSFKVVDVMTKEVIAEDSDAQATVAALRTIRSVVDIDIFVWEQKLLRWRQLSFGEKRVLWDRRTNATLEASR